MTGGKRNRTWTRGALLAASAALACAAHAGAATIVVTGNGDADASDGVVTLREAIVAANTNAANNDAPAGDTDLDTIDLTGITGTITLGSALPTISEDLAIVGPGSATLTVSGNNASRIIATSAPLSISGLTLADGSASGSYPANCGGAIYADTAGADVELDGCVVTSCGAGARGGAVYMESATLTLDDCTVSSNTATLEGGGVYVNRYDLGSGGVGLHATDSTISGNVSSDSGGGVYLYYAGVEMRRSTVSGNSAAGDGGGLCMMSDWNYDHLVESSTFSGNEAAGNGGGARFGDNCTTVIRNSTFTLNVCDADSNGTGNGGGLAYYDPVTLASAVFSGNTDNGGQADDLFRGAGSVTATCCLVEDAGGGHGITDGVDGNIVGQSAALGALADNGGPTLSHLPGAASPAVDAGSNPAALSVDQRGWVRASGGGVDIGGVESESSGPPVPPSNSNDDCGTGTASPSCLLALVGALLALSRRRGRGPTAVPAGGRCHGRA